MHHEDFTEDKKEQINYKASFKLVLDLMLNQRRGFIIAFIYLIISTIIGLANPIFAKHILDVSIPQKDAHNLFLFTGFFTVNIFLSLCFNYLLYMQLVKTGQKIIVSLKKTMLAHILSLGMDFYSGYPVGRISARVQSDTSTLYELFTETAITIFKDVFMFFSVFGIMLFYNYKLTMILMPMFPVILVIVYFFVKLSSPLFIKSRKIMAELTGYITESLNGIDIIRAYNGEETACKKLYDINSRKFSAEYHSELYGVVFFLGIFALQPAGIAAVFGIGGEMALKGDITVGVLIMFILYITQLFEPIFRFSEHVSIIQRSFSAGHRIANILALKPGLVEKNNPLTINSIKKGIEFKNVWMRYSEKDNWVLKDVSFYLEKGKSIAIAGETGGGKTTISNLIFRFYEFQKGQVLVDGVDLKDISFKSLRSSIGLIQQDIYLFPGTMFDNLKMMDSTIPDRKVYDAVKMMGLEDFFKKHSLSKVIVEKGVNLSIGEKQVIALTRAMVLEQDFLILDEATSHMDPYTERLVTAAIKKLLKHKTLMVIAHRLSTIKDVDNILVLSGGKVKESGTHNQLLSLGGLYSKYYQLQNGGKA